MSLKKKTQGIIVATITIIRRVSFIPCLKPIKFRVYVLVKKKKKQDQTQRAYIYEMRRNRKNWLVENKNNRTNIKLMFVTGLIKKA